MSRYILRRAFHFEASHTLPHVAESHKCRRLHGHSYEAVVEVSGDELTREGWVMDFGEIKQRVQPLIDRLDHRHLNDIDGLPNPTAELLAKWLWDRLAGNLPGLRAIEISETKDLMARYSES